MFSCKCWVLGVPATFSGAWFPHTYITLVSSRFFSICEEPSPSFQPVSLSYLFSQPQISTGLVCPTLLPFPLFPTPVSCCLSRQAQPTAFLSPLSPSLRTRRVSQPSSTETLTRPPYSSALIIGKTLETVGLTVLSQVPQLILSWSESLGILVHCLQKPVLCCHQQCP